MFYTTCCMLADFYPRMFERGDKNKKCEWRAFYMNMKTPISYYGGKQNLVKELLPLFPKHVQYVEPFTGGGAVFFAKGKSKNEVIDMFDAIAPNYDKFTSLFSFGIDHLWRAYLTNELKHFRPQIILDVACGTGSQAKSLLQLEPQKLILLDPS